MTSRKPTRQLSADQSMRYAELLRVSDADAVSYTHLLRIGNQHGLRGAVGRSHAQHEYGDKHYRQETQSLQR